MIRIINSEKDLQRLGTESEIDHPLWKGLKVTTLPSRGGLFGGNYTNNFYDRKYVQVGNGIYVSASNHPFLKIWSLYKRSQKTYAAFQADLLKSSDSTLPEEARIAAALSLSNGEGCNQRDLVVQRGWHDVADEIAVIFPTRSQYLGQGGFGIVTKAEGFLINPVEHRVTQTSFALKKPQDEEAEIFLDKATRLLEDIRAPGIVEPSFKIGVRSRYGMEFFWAMTIYSGDFRAWSKKNRKNQDKIVETFLTGFRGLKALQDKLVVHLDLKPQNLLVQEEGDLSMLDINDFDGAFLLPTSLDKKSLDKFKEELEEFSLIGTYFYLRDEERETLKKHLLKLKTQLEIAHEDRDAAWFEAFSDRLLKAATLLKQIQIYEWGWTLVAALTNTPPYNLLPTLNTEDWGKTLPPIEPSPSKVENTLSELDNGLKEILSKAINPDPLLRPSHEEFSDQLTKHLTRELQNSL